MKPKKLALTQFDFARGIYAEFKYTISRGAETQGYNICTLYVNRERVSQCMGGGYDMRGTALGDWMEAQFSEELKTLEASWEKGKYDDPEHKRGGFYGMFINRPGAKRGTVKHWQEGDKISLDGGCGISCMQSILKAIGYEMQWIPTRKKNDNQYWIKPVEVEVAK